MASGWGGLNDIIEEALERKRKEDEEKRKAEEVKRALEKYRAGERQSQEPVQGPRPAPAPLPNPWEKPVFSQPAPSPVTAIPQPSPLQQYQGPSVDTGPTDIGGGQSHSDTVQSRLPQPSMPTVQPRSLSPDLAVSTSDRLRDNYNAPNRPIVPTSPQGPAANPWQAPTFGQPQAQYQLQPDEQAPVTQQNILNTQGEWTNWLGDRAQALGQAITSVPDQLNDWWQQTPGGQYFNQTVQQRDSYVPPTIPQAVNNILGNALSADTTLGKVAGVAALPVTGAIPIIDAYSGVIPGMRGVIKGGANALSFLNELGMEAANEPWLQGYSPAEIINADLAGAIAGMKATSGMENYAPTMEKFGVFSPAFDAARTEYLVKSGEFRKQVTGLVEQGQTQANMALRNLPSGYNAAQSTLDNLVNRDQKVAQLQKQAIDAQNAGDFLQAGEYFRQAQELQNMTSVEMVEQNMNPGVEFLYGMIFDPTNFVGPFMELAHLTPEASAVRKATRAVRNAETGNTLEKLKNAVYGGERLTQALAEGTKAGQKVYQEIITPYQNAVEKAQNATVLLARTRESKAALDAEAIWQGLAGILANITSKQDTKIVLETLLTEPGKLVTGLNNLSQEAMIRLANSQGFAQWGKGVFNDDFARRLALLVPARDEILGMKSLQGEGLAKSYEVLAELNGIVVDYARRANGAKLPTRLPFGASKVDILRLGQDSAVITYLNKNGDVVQRGIETTLSEAQRRLNEINKALKNAGKKGILDYARIPADIQRAIMSDTWLGMRPANWIGNALGATTGLFANDAYTLLPLSKMQDDIAKKFGGVLGNRRMQDVIQPEADMVRGAKQEMGSGFLDNLARAVTRNPDNVVSRGMKKLYDIPYGKTEIKLPGGLAIPFGEEAFYTRAFYVPFSRAFAGGIAESINRDLVPVLQTIEGMSPQAIQRVGDWVTNLAINGSRSDVAQGIRKYVGKPTIRMTLKSLGVPPELLTPQAAYAIENLIMDAAPSELERIWFGVHGVPGVEDMDGIRDILAKERNPAASVLNIAGSQPGIYDWTDVDIAEEAAHLADGLARDAQKAGVEVTQAAQEAQKIATDYLQGQQNTFKRVLDDLSSQPNKPDTWSVTMDFWQDVNIIKNKARRYVDELGKRATQVNTPEAWQQKWRGTQEIYTSLQKQLGELADEARLNLQAVANGSEYTPKYNWWETIEGYLQWDEEAFRQARTIELGSPDAADMAQWQEVITRNREYIDNSVYELFGAFQRYPSLENFDIVRHGMQKLEAMGAQVRYNLDQMLDKLVAGEISKEAYAKARNLAWNNYFDAGVQYNNALGQAIVRNGVLTEAGVDLKWTQDGIEFQLTRPSTTPNKFWARNLTTGQEEEFTAAQTADELTPFTVPKSVIDDFNRLVGNEAAIDEATAAVMQEISDSAPEVIRPTRTEPATVEGLVNEGLRPPRMEPEVTWMEPDVEQNVPGYNGAGARRAEPLPEEIPSTAAQERAAYYDEEVGRWVEEQRARRAAAGTEEEVPEEAPRSRRRVPSAWYEDAEGNRVPVYQDELDNAVEPVAPVEEQAAPTIPTNDDIRKAASDAGIATATKAGKPTDKHLVNSLNKRMGSSVKSLDELSDTERLRAIDVMRARSEEQISRMSPAEAQRAVQEATPARPKNSVAAAEYQSKEGKIVYRSDAPERNIVEHEEFHQAYRNNRITVTPEIKQILEKDKRAADAELQRLLTDDSPLGRWAQDVHSRLKKIVDEAGEEGAWAIDDELPKYFQFYLAAEPAGVGDIRLATDLTDDATQYTTLRLLEAIGRDVTGRSNLLNPNWYEESLAYRVSASSDFAASLMGKKSGPTSNAPAFGTGTRTSKPTTENMFATTGEDLPLMSGAAKRTEDAGAFKPSVSGGQESMFDLRPQMGTGEPSYKPRTPKQPKVTTTGDMAKMEAQAAKETRAAMQQEWDRKVAAAFSQSGTGSGRSIPDLTTLARQYNHGGMINLNLNRGEVNRFEDIYGVNVAGYQIDNLDDLRDFLQQYVDLQKQVDQGYTAARNSKQFSKMSAQEILKETRQEFLAAGFSDDELKALLGKGTPEDRRNILDMLATLRGEDADVLNGLVGYDFSVPSVAQLLGVETPEEVAGNTIRDWIFRSRKTGNATAPQVGEIAEHTIRSLNDLERTLKARLPEILQGEPNQLTGAQRLRVVDAVLDWLPNFDNELTRAQKVGDRMANWVMLNYQDRRNLDTIANLLMIPFHYYWSRMPSRTLMMSLQKPGLVNFYYEALRSIALENEQAGVPERLRGTLPNPLHQYGIGNERFNASAYLRYIIPYTSYAPSPYVEEDPTATGVNLWTQRLQKWNFPLGPLTLATLDMLDGNMDAYYGDILNNMIPVFGVPVSSIYQGWTGNMPAKNGVMAKFGFGPDTTDDGFGLDAYRARRAVEWIANEEDIDPVLMGYANQVILNQYNGDPIDKDVDPAYLDAAIELAQRGVKRAAGDRMESRATAYTMIGSTQPYPEAEQQVNQGRGRYYASGYDPMTNPNGSDALQNNILDADPNITRSWVKSSDTPGIDAQISQLYDEAQANGNWDEVMPQIEALKAQQNRTEPLPQPQPTAGSTSDILRGVYGDAYKGMNPQEQLEALQKEAANKYWDEYLALEDNAEKAKYLRENPEFAEIYKQNIIDKGEEPEDWWSDYPEPGGKKATSKKGAAGTSASSGVSGDNGLPPGSVTRDDFSEEELDQLYGEYLGFNEEKDWDGQKAWLLDHPEFARLEADRKLEKDGEYPWWYDDVFGEDGAAVRGAASIRNIPSHPTSIADVLRQPYDYAEAGKWAKDRERSSGYSKDSGKGVSGDWSTEWDEYRALGEDWEAKRQYMLDHPEFAKYYIGKYGDDAAWWLEWEERTGTGYGGRSYSYYGGGGGGGGSPYLGGSYTSYHNAQVAPRYFDRSLWEAPRFQPWIPYSRPNPDWLQAGRELAPEPIRKWIPPRWS